MENENMQAILEGPVKISMKCGETLLVYRKVYDEVERYGTVAESYDSDPNGMEKMLDGAQERGEKVDEEWNARWRTLFDVYYADLIKAQ